MTCINKASTLQIFSPLLVIAAAGCSSAEAGETEEHAPHWGYGGEVGAEHWGELNDDYFLCEEGMEQSPIDLSDPVEDSSSLELTSGAAQITLVNNGHTVQANVQSGAGSLVHEGSEYGLVQFHFHALSEHTIDGVHYPMEMHLVHATEQGKLAVVGVLIEQGSEHEALDPVFSNLPQQADEMFDLESDVELSALLPDSMDHFHYDGSLTTPPCSEGVEWFVMGTPIQASAEQINSFTSLYDDNYRPTEPLGDRELELDQ